MDKRNFAFDRVNFILLAVGMAVVVIGFILMSGAPSTEETFNPDIFSTMRVKVAPVVCFLGFASMIYAIARKPKDGGVVDTHGSVTKDKQATNNKAVKK